MEQFIKKYGSVDVHAIFRDAVKQNKDTIIQLNKSQLLKGEDPSGKQYPAYSEAYARRKNKPLKPKTLKDTGDFHKGFDATFSKEYYEMFSRDKKNDFLEEEYKPFGLQDENNQKIIDNVQEIISKNILTAITS